MKFLVSILVVLGFAVTASAYEPTLDTMDHDQGEKCFQKAFEDAKPTNQQKLAAVGIASKVHDFYLTRKPAIEAAAIELQTAMRSHPIDPRTAAKKSDRLRNEITPVSKACFAGAVAIINLLTLEQRVDFNKSLRDCYQH